STAGRGGSSTPRHRRMRDGSAAKSIGTRSVGSSTRWCRCLGSSGFSSRWGFTVRGRPMRQWLHLTASVTLALAAVTSAPAAAAFPVPIRVDAAKPIGELRPIWRFFGADEPNYAYLKDGKKLLAELGELRPKSVYFRTHNLLTSGDGTPAL